MVQDPADIEHPDGQQTEAARRHPTAQGRVALTVTTVISAATT